MAGVIDEEGQWERCGRCRRFVLIETLGYEQPSEQFQYGRDLCSSCSLALLVGAPATLPKEQWKDQLSPEEAQRIHEQVKRDIEEHGLKVTSYNADGTVTDESIPPKKSRS
jgi:hypothetical protein